ncbi:MAG: 30S ribosomal protein S17e [Nanoarchaeota archaeon]|nr:30S ribosomal protein S17e [Nanoarchaeota archaeon]MBU1501820.1 30S ribosomal protein S17e [Nanoarchaeota archaeon]MBU2459386.1 30S ribosomal protein S17e [Nanoarchaeota archaeon]
MGKIKSKQIKRTGKELVKRGIQFSDNFDKNKEILGKTMPSKKIRNQIAGFLVRFERQRQKEIKASA